MPSAFDMRLSTLYALTCIKQKATLLRDSIFLLALKCPLKTEQTMETKLKEMCELASVESLFKTTVQALGLLVSFS